MIVEKMLFKAIRFSFFISPIFVIFSCGNDKYVFEAKLENYENYKKIKFVDLKKNGIEYNNKLIEIEGNFNIDSGSQYLNDGNYLHNIWLDFNIPLKDLNSLSFQENFAWKINEKKVKIRGKYIHGDPGNAIDFKGKLDSIVFICAY
jgi:hypothetical protein